MISLIQILHEINQNASLINWLIRNVSAYLKRRKPSFNVNTQLSPRLFFYMTLKVIKVIHLNYIV